KERGRVDMLTKEQIIELVEPLKDAFLHTTFKETGAIVSVTVREEKKHVSIKLAIGQANSAEQMDLQQETVGIWKKNGANTGVLRCEQLPVDVIEKHKPESEKDNSILGQQKQPHYIAIARGKGGVGKSTVTVNIAMALKRLGKKVGIIDADIYGFSVPDMMGVEDRPIVRGERIDKIGRAHV